jgi:uncharacterized OB-fold protein
MVCPRCSRNIAPRLQFCCSLKRAGSWEELWIQGRGRTTSRENLEKSSYFLFNKKHYYHYITKLRVVPGFESILL